MESDIRHEYIIYLSTESLAAKASKSLAAKASKS